MTAALPTPTAAARSTPDAERVAHALAAGVVSASLLRSLLAPYAPTASVACVGLGRVFVTLDADAVGRGTDARFAADLIRNAYAAHGAEVRLTSWWRGDLIVERA